MDSPSTPRRPRFVATLGARILVAVALAGTFLSACDVHGISAPGTLASITVTPNANLAVGASQQVTAVGRDAEGRVVSITPTWTIASGGGTVNQSGMFTAGSAPGVFANTIVASVGGISGAASATVTAGPLASISLSPNPVTLAANGTQQFVVIGKDASGNVVPFTPSWSVVSGGGSIDASGIFTAGVVAGTFTNTVQASSNGIKAFATVTVTPGPLASLTVTPNPVTLAAGAKQQFTVVGKDAGGNVVPFAVTWTVVAGGGAIDAAGLFTAGGAPGTYTNTVKATSGSVSGTATVIVTVGALSAITVIPNPVTLATGGTQQFIATGTDAAGNVVVISPTWGVVNGGGSIDINSGIFTAGNTVGTFTNTVRASVGNLTGFATVTVAAGPLASIIVTPNPATLGAGATQQFTATGKDAAGNTVGAAITWTVVAGGGSINASGLFTAGPTPGTFTNTVKATSGSVSGTATVIVTAGPLAVITVTPNPATVAIGGTQQFTATGADAFGNAVPITPVWAVVAGGGSIDINTGLFTAGNTPGTFSNTVRASVGGIAGTASVIVTTGPLATIVVSPNPATVQTGGVQQFTAVGKDAGGNVVPIIPVWSVVNNGGTINAVTGLFTAGGVPASYANTVKATVGGISGFATVNVTAPPALATIVVSPNPASVPTGGTQQFTAVGRDGNGNIFPIVPVWTATGGGTINAATGLFTAGAVAGTFTNAITATVGAISGQATVIVTGVAPVPLVNLGAAGPNGIMAGTAFTCVSLGTIFADIAISPGSTVTGFPPCVITGTQHLNDALAVQAQLDLTAAYNVLAGLPCPPANAIVGNLGGTVKPAGVYCTASGIGITGTLTLDGGGDPNAKFVFQAGSTLITAGNIVLINGAQAKNVYFQVGSSATLGTASQIQGNILALTSITLVDNANLTGRALARNGAVSLGTGNTIILP